MLASESKDSHQCLLLKSVILMCQRLFPSSSSSFAAYSLKNYEWNSKIRIKIVTMEIWFLWAFCLFIKKVGPEPLQLLLRGKPLCARRSIGFVGSRYPGSCNPGHNVRERDWEVPLQNTYSAAKDIFSGLKKDSDALSLLWAQPRPGSSWRVPTLHPLG